MRSTDIIRVLALLLGAGWIMRSLGARSGEPKQDLPNIVLVMADDQGWGDAGCIGHPDLEAPHFDAATAAGLRGSNRGGAWDRVMKLSTSRSNTAIRRR